MKHQITILPNDITVVTEQMLEIESVAINVIVKTGSRNEPVELNGISHFLEHMAFKGTKKRTALQIAEAFDAIGGYFNAYTSREHTVYTAKTLKNDVEIALDILSDILQNSIFAKEEIERELNVILQEMARSEDTPDDIVFDYFQSVAFPNQPIGRPILGNKEVISKFDTNVFLNYMNSRYFGKNIVISVVGNIDHRIIVEFITKMFNNYRSDQENQMPLKANYHGGYSFTNKDLEQAQFVLGFKGISYFDDSLYSNAVLAIILGGGMSSRLFQEIREKRGLAYTVGCFSSNYYDNGLFVVYASTSEDRLKELCEVTCNELINFASNINDQEIARAKSILKANFLMSQESCTYRADDLGKNYAIYNRHFTVNEVVKQIEKVDKVSIKNNIETILTNSKPSLAILGKIKNGLDYDKIVAKFS